MKKTLWSILLGVLITITASCALAAIDESKIAIQGHIVVICRDNSVELVLPGDSEWKKLKGILEAVHPEKAEPAFKRAVKRACKQDGGK